MLLRYLRRDGVSILPRDEKYLKKHVVIAQKPCIKWIKMMNSSDPSDGSFDSVLVRVFV